MDATWINVVLFAAGLLAGFAFPDLIQAILNLRLYSQSPEKLAQESLWRLNHDFFSCFIEADYPDNVYVFERRIHMQKRQFMQAALRLLKKPDQKQLLDEFSRRYGAMMTYSQLRWRVTDFAVFAVCRDEFDRLLKATTACLQGKATSEKVATALGNLEDVFQQVIKVSSPEPLVFLLFIEAVKECFPS